MRMGLAILMAVFFGTCLISPSSYSWLSSHCDGHPVTSSTEDEKEVCECGEDEDGECIPCPVDKKEEKDGSKKS